MSTSSFWAKVMNTNTRMSMAASMTMAMQMKELCLCMSTAMNTITARCAMCVRFLNARRFLRKSRRRVTITLIGKDDPSVTYSVGKLTADAEGKVHGMRPEDVHFHEVGAVDSIVDIVGTAICLDYLEIEKIFVSRVNTGSGTVHTQHGLMMVPAPATAELLRLFPTYHEGAAKELTTPTGAAVLAALAEFSDHVPTDLLTECIAYGAGTWDLELPNVVRLYIGECKGGGKRDLSLIETNIDDMDAQLFGYVSERLFALGALDVWTTPIYMKKNRPAHMLSVLVAEDKKAQCLSLLFSETTSIGMRVLHVDERVEAVRHTALVDTPHGKVRCKVSAYGGKIVSLSPEYDDCREIAAREGIPLKRVRQEALDDLRERLGE